MRYGANDFINEPTDEELNEFLEINTQDTIFHDEPIKATRETLGISYTEHVPLEAIAAAAASFLYGAKKYSDRNWERGLPWQVLINSLKRHVEDFERGSNYDDGDKGSGLHQVCMIMADASMLCASVIRGIGQDDRLIPVDENALSAKQCTDFIQEQLQLAEKFKNKDTAGGN
jgi:hypothetical protein